MPSDSYQVEQTIQSVKGLTDSILSYTGVRIDQANEALDYDIYTIETVTRLRIAKIEADLIRVISILYQDAEYHTMRAYWHASPALQAILAAIWAAILLIWQIIKWIIQVVNLIKALKLDDLLAQYWDWFYEAREKFRRWASELSEALGWGVDGLLHIIHATQSFTGVLGGLMGKNYNWMQAEWMLKTGNVLDLVSKTTNQIKENPGEILEILFQNEMGATLKLSSDWGKELFATIDEGLTKAKSALWGLTLVSHELSSIQEDMPQVVRDNIPQGIWDGLERFEEVIESEIMPRVLAAERQLALVGSLMTLQGNKLMSLADKLAHPGTNLLSIDNLPPYMRDPEEWAVDDIASRQFNQWANEDRAAMSADLSAFTLIDQAASSPIPALPFMTIESPARGALMGIVAEPQETWFVGGYNSIY